MPCTDCDKNKGLISFKPLDEDCPKLPTGGCTPVDATCVNYTGSNLTMLGLGSNINAETIFKAIDTYLGQIGGISYSDYNMHCLTDDQEITTEAQFVSAITAAHCDLRQDFEEFVDNTINYDTLSARIDGIINPGLTLCASSGIVPADNYTTILTKLAQKICDTDAFLNLAPVNWSKCFTVTNPPSNLASAFNLIEDQICQVKGSIGQTVLPTFDTTLTCLDHKTPTTSLVTTIEDLMKVSCTTAKVNMSELSWGCYQSDVDNQGGDLQAAMQVISNTLNNLNAYTYIFNETDFDVTPQGACQPKLITSKVKGGASGHNNTYVGPDDPTGGDLMGKMSAGKGISFERSTESKLVVDSVESGKVKVSSSDEAGYIGDKITTPSTKGPISLLKSETESEVQLRADVDTDLLANQILTSIQENPQLLAKLVNMVCGCGGYSPE